MPCHPIRKINFPTIFYIIYFHYSNEMLLVFCSPFAERVIVENRTDSNDYHEIFNDSAYESTLIKKYLTEELFKKLLEQQDNPSIVDCIVKVAALPSNPSGVIALNANCYEKFGDLFEPIIKDIHCVDEVNKQADCDWGDEMAFGKLENEAIVSSEISCCRSIANIPFIPGINEQDLQIILTQVSIWNLLFE